MNYNSTDEEKERDRSLVENGFITQNWDQNDKERLNSKVCLSIINILF